MYDFTLPDYKGKSIVNLMSSISQSFCKKHSYSELNDLKSKELDKFKNIVLIVVDGLGYNYLIKQKDSFLFEHLKSKMTSTFLSTTACANTVFLTGYPPQQHALTAWDMYLKEIGAITTILPFVPQFGGYLLTNFGFEISKIIGVEPFHKEFNGKCFTVIDKYLANSHFNSYVSKYTEMVPVNSYKNIFSTLKKIIKKRSSKRRFVHAYISDFDTYAHTNGVNSKHVLTFFWDLDERIRKLSNSIKGTNTKLIIVSDHGLIDMTEDSQLFVEDVLGLKECLTMPLSGEPRVRYCYVRPSKVKEFERIVETKLSKYCWCYKSGQIIKDNLYGLGKPNLKLFDRVGDYILIMKKNYILKDKLANYYPQRYSLKGRHGGVTDDEMFIPLVVIDC